MISISSLSSSDARFDMLAKKRVRISSLAPLSATVSAFLSTRLTISRMPASSIAADVFEHEHQVANLHREVLRLGFDALERRLADAAVEPIEQFRDRAHAAVLLARAAAERLQPLIDDARDPADDVG